MGPAHRGRGLASRALALFVEHLADEGRYAVATLLIHGDNEQSLALAARARFPRVEDLDGHPLFKLALRAEPAAGVSRASGGPS